MHNELRKGLLIGTILTFYSNYMIATINHSLATVAPSDDAVWSRIDDAKMSGESVNSRIGWTTGRAPVMVLLGGVGAAGWVEDTLWAPRTVDALPSDQTE